MLAPPVPLRFCFPPGARKRGAAAAARTQGANLALVATQPLLRPRSASCRTPQKLLIMQHTGQPHQRILLYGTPTLCQTDQDKLL